MPDIFVTEEKGIDRELESEKAGAWGRKLHSLTTWLKKL